MKQLLTICAVVCLIFTAASVKADVITEVVRIGGASPGQPEIAAWPDGLQEEAQAYMDRWGKWPPDNEGYFCWDEIPDELVGADYVKTYNKDKKAEDLIYSVTVGQKAKLYIFMDYRYVQAHGNPPFSWLTDGSSGAVFSDTGLRILLQEVKVLPKPKKKTRLFYIYAAEVSAGYYKLKATYDGSGSRSFYGIAAVKLVDIDIKPGSYPNAVNLDSKGVIPVAILSGPSFKATTVDPDTVVLGGSSVAVRGKANKAMVHKEDVNGDGLLDLVCQVETENLDPGILQTGFAILSGKTYSGQPIQGKDKITIVPPKANIQIDQINLPIWEGGWTAMSWDQSQTFQPGLPILTGVDIDILTANPHLGDDTITVEILKSDVVLATASQLVSVGFTGLLHFDFPTEVAVNIGETYVLSVPGTKDTFGWKFGGDTYSNGIRFLGVEEKPGTDWFFQTYGIPATPAVMLDGTALFIMDEVDAGNIDAELERSLLVNINAALAALDKGNPNAAKVSKNDLKALVNHVEVKTNKKIKPEAAAEIIQ